MAKPFIIHAAVETPNRVGRGNGAAHFIGWERLMEALTVGDTIPIKDYEIVSCVKVTSAGLTLWFADKEKEIYKREVV